MSAIGTTESMAEAGRFGEITCAVTSSWSVGKEEMWR